MLSVDCCTSSLQPDWSLVESAFRNSLSIWHHASCSTLRANLPSYEVGLYEQNVLTFLLYTKPELLDNGCV